MKLLFQPGNSVYVVWCSLKSSAAEEGKHGAKTMVEEGCLKDCDMCFGIHLWNTIPFGEVGISSGPVMANSDRFYITINGRGGHGSMPHDCSDPILAAAALVQNSQQLVSRNLDPRDQGSNKSEKCGLSLIVIIKRCCLVWQYCK